MAVPSYTLKRTLRAPLTVLTVVGAALLMAVGAAHGNDQRARREVIEAIVIRTGGAGDTSTANSEGRRVALLAGASQELADAFGQQGAFSAGLADSYSLSMTVANKRACLVLVRTHDVRTMLLFTPDADAPLLQDMLVAHERTHCHDDVSIQDLDTPVEQILSFEVQADRAALAILRPAGENTRHDLARQAWMRWRNMDAFLAGKTDHWTLPFLSDATVTAHEVDAVEALRKRAARIMLDINATDRASQWEELRRAEMGRDLPPWAEVLESIERVYGSDSGAFRRALRGPPIQ